jgi:hypothetical protein
MVLSVVDELWCLWLEGSRQSRAEGTLAWLSHPPLQSAPTRSPLPALAPGRGDSQEANLLEICDSSRRVACILGLLGLESPLGSQLESILKDGAVVNIGTRVPGPSLSLLTSGWTQSHPLLGTLRGGGQATVSALFSWLVR